MIRLLTLGVVMALLTLPVAAQEQQQQGDAVNAIYAYDGEGNFMAVILRGNTSYTLGNVDSMQSLNVETLEMCVHTTRMERQGIFGQTEPTDSVRCYSGDELNQGTIQDVVAMLEQLETQPEQPTEPMPEEDNQTPEQPEEENMTPEEPTQEQPMEQ